MWNLAHARHPTAHSLYPHHRLVQSALPHQQAPDQTRFGHAQPTPFWTQKTHFARSRQSLMNRQSHPTPDPNCHLGLDPKPASLENHLGHRVPSLAPLAARSCHGLCPRAHVVKRWRHPPSTTVWTSALRCHRLIPVNMATVMKPANLSVLVAYSLDQRPRCLWKRSSGANSNRKCLGIDGSYQGVKVSVQLT